MAILLTGGTGYTSSQCANLLQKANIPFVVTSRKGNVGVPAGMPAVKFDFSDPSTYDGPFQHQFPNNEKISAIYVVPPRTADPIAAMNAFIDHAVKKYGVRRFVLVTGSSSERDQPHGIGRTWRHLEEMKVEYSVLRATWFMENFSQGWWANTIKSEDKFYTACEDGRAPFVSAKDIAVVATWCLTTTQPLEQSYRILGPELLTFDQVATKLSKFLGRNIQHVRLLPEEVVKVYMNAYFPEPAAKFMSFLETETARGGEAILESDAVKMASKGSGLTFDEWMEEATWK